MEIRLHTSQLARARELLGRKANRFHLGLETALRSTAATAARRVKFLSPVAFGDLRAKITSRPMGPLWHAVVTPTRYAAFVERGRERGKPPPAAALVPWVRLRGIDRKVRAEYVAGLVHHRTRRSSLSFALSAAFLVARAIGRRGIRGRYMFLRAGIEARRDLRARVASLLVRFREPGAARP